MLDAAAIEERNREKEIVKRRIDALHQACVPFRAALDVEMGVVNGSKDEPSSFDRLDDPILFGTRRHGDPEFP